VDCLALPYFSVSCERVVDSFPFLREALVSRGEGTFEVFVL